MRRSSYLVILLSLFLCLSPDYSSYAVLAKGKGGKAKGSTVRPRATPKTKLKSRSAARPKATPKSGSKAKPNRATSPGKKQGRVRKKQGSSKVQAKKSGRRNSGTKKVRRKGNRSERGNRTSHARKGSTAKRKQAKAVNKSKSRKIQALAKKKAALKKAASNNKRAQREISVNGHIFRNSGGHVNPKTKASQARYMKLFKKTAANKSNANNAVVDPVALKNGVKGYAKTYRNGQVWVNVRNGRIINAGVNKVPRK